MITYETNKPIPSSEFAKNLDTYLSIVKDNPIKKLAISKNDKVEAFLMSKENYENMVKELKTFESQNLLNSIKAGLDDVKNGKTKHIDTLWNALDV